MFGLRYLATKNNIKFSLAKPRLREMTVVAKYKRQTGVESKAFAASKESIVL